MAFDDMGLLLTRGAGTHAALYNSERLAQNLVVTSEQVFGLRRTSQDGFNVEEAGIAFPNDGRNKRHPKTASQLPAAWRSERLYSPEQGREEDWPNSGGHTTLSSSG